MSAYSLPVLMYHYVSRFPGAIAVSPEHFEDQCRGMAEHGWRGIGLDEAEAFLLKGAPLPPRSLLITFDDGYLDNYVYAWPILRKYGHKGVVFAVTERMEAEKKCRPTLAEVWEGLPPSSLPPVDAPMHDTPFGYQVRRDMFFSWEEARHMESSGVMAVAAHSARAWMGENAIHKAADILNRLNAYEPATVNVDGLDYREGLNATLISGGKGTNVIPDECRVHVNYRFAPDKSLAEAKALMMGADAGAELGNGEHVATGGVFEGYGIEMKDESPSARPGLNAPLAQDLVRLVKERTGRDPLAKLGWTDVARFSQLGIPAVNLGAGDPLLAHKHDEQVPESDLTAMAAILTDWLV